MVGLRPYNTPLVSCYGVGHHRYQYIYTHTLLSHSKNNNQYAKSLLLIQCIKSIITDNIYGVTVPLWKRYDNDINTTLFNDIVTMWFNQYKFFSLIFRYPSSTHHIPSNNKSSLKLFYFYIPLKTTLIFHFYLYFLFLFTHFYSIGLMIIMTIYNQTQ